MLGQILTEITQSNNEDNTFLQRLQQQNEEIVSEIQKIQSDLNKLPLKDIVDYIENHSSSSLISIKKCEKIEHIFTVVEQFHTLFATSQKENKRCEHLLEEIKLILEIIHHYDLFGLMELYQEPSSQINLKYYKDLMEIISQQILQYQNQQNINKFESESEEICQQYVNVIQFYSKFKDLTVFLYQSSIKSNYRFRQDSLKIRKQYFSSVWTEAPHFYEEFLSQLGKFFEKFITYDINDRQYTMSSYTLNLSSEELQIIRASKLIFDSNEVGLHYESLTNNLINLHSFFQEIETITPRQKHNLISSLKKSTLDRIKSYIEYLLPYLSMDLRRKLLSHLSIDTSIQSLNIYELLVSLRMCGKDADMLVKSIQHIIQKVREDANTLTIIIKFIQIAKQNKKNYHMNFFVCNQIIEELEEGNITTEIVDAIKRLLIIREEMRMKIHNVDGKQ